jgi:hypothetical protein
MPGVSRRANPFGEHISTVEVLRGFMAQFGKSPWSPSIAGRSATTRADPRTTDGNGVQKSSHFEHLCVS